ncbi:MAG: hypothetical protein HKP58_08090 [Desulfatitalea sp.]|nr:hypothetical protein [Desulfatitalea sp.]NNK00360.1 hypothetical protein [Desulfatitalea sp.]
MRKNKHPFILMSLLVLLLASAGAGNAQPGPDQDMSDFPPWIWPYIRPVEIFTIAVTDVEMTFDQAAKGLQEAVLLQCKCFTAGDYSFKELIAMVDAQFKMQLVTLHFAQTKVAGFGMGRMIAYDDDDWCGTPPKPWPWPHYLLDLVTLQADIFRKQLPNLFKLTREETMFLNAHLDRHVTEFAIALE